MKSWTDAIANAGGTTIKTLNTTTGVNITVSNILGAIYNGNSSTMYAVVLYQSSKTRKYFGLLSEANSTIPDLSTREPITVFYF